MAEEGKRSNLGRGLSALFGEEPEPAADAQPGRLARMVSIEALKPGTYQPRQQFDENDIEDLASSIRELGILQPILIRATEGDDDSYEIIAGERRWRAAQRAQLHEVPVIERELTDSEALEIALVENLQRENLSPLDEAEGYRQLMDEFDHTQDNLAKVLGKSRSHVANMIRLLNLPQPVKDYLNAGDLTAGHARALINADDPISAAKSVVRRGLNVRQTEKLVQKKPASKPKATAPQKDVDTIALEKDLAALLGLRVDIKFTGRGGSLTVHYESLEQLDDILHRLRAGPGHAIETQPSSEDHDPLQVDDVDAAIAQLEEGAAIEGHDVEIDETAPADFALSDADIEGLFEDDDPNT